MRKILICLVTGAAVTAAPAPAKSGKHDNHPSGHKCRVHKVGYHAKGTLVSQALTQTQGAATPADRRDDRYSGDLTVDVTKANHHAPTGVQSFTVTDVRVRYYDANHDGTKDVPVAGDTVGIFGRITKLARRCDQTGFVPTVTVKRIHFKQAKPAPTP